MAELHVPTSEGVPLRLELAGAGSRFAAALVDLVLFAVLWLAALVSLSVIARLDGSGLADFTLRLLAVGGLLVHVLALTAFQVATRGRTPGKQLFELRVVGDEGNPATGLALLLRNLLWLVDVLPLPVPLGLVVILVTGRHQRLGDLVAGTVVVHEPRRTALVEPWPRERHEDLQLRELDLTPALAARFDGEDLDLLREVITRRGLGHEGRERLFAQVAKHYLERLGREEAVSSRAVLKELYLFLREQRQERVGQG